jgi:molecular chaperone DnaK
VSIRIFQGESSVAEQNRFLGQLDLEGLASAQRGQARIEVSFDVDKNGLLRVTAKDQGTGKEKMMHVTCNVPCSFEARPARGPSNQRALHDVRNQANHYIAHVETFLENRSAQLFATDCEPIYDLIARLCQAASGEDISAIRRTLFALEQAVSAMASFLRDHPQEATESRSPSEKRRIDMNLEI